MPKNEGETPTMNLCDFNHRTNEEVRLLPYSSDGNLIVCHRHYLHELKYRVERNDQVQSEYQLVTPKWENLKIYGKGVTTCELSENIGKTAELTVTLGKNESLRLAVTIIDVREVYGRTDYRVEYNGQKVWASEYHVKLVVDNDLILNGGLSI